MDNYLLISDAAKEVKVESHVLRYWEEELHLPIKRNELGHRYYTKEDVERFKQIKGMKERGLQLKAIKMILKDGRLDVLDISPEETKTTSGQTASSRETAQSGIPRQEMSGRDMTGKRTVRQTEFPEGNGEEKEEAAGGMQGTGQLAIDIVPGKGGVEDSFRESREDKSRRLQWLLQQLIRQTLQENNGQLCREIRESVVKELDYQFRMQEEREEARDRMLAERDEEHYKKMDELLRRKSRRAKKEKPERPEKTERPDKLRTEGRDGGPERYGDNGSEEGRDSGGNGEQEGIRSQGRKKKRFFS